MRRLALTIAALAGLCAVGPATVAIGGGEGSRQSSSYTLAQKKPGKSTSERFVFDYHGRAI